MRIDILTLFPEVIEPVLKYSILKKAETSGTVKIVLHNIRDYGIGKHQQVDDAPFGGEAGMVMMIEPIHHLITDLQKQRSYDEIIYTSPDGARLTQPAVNQLSLLQNIIVLCGHYKGIDQRIRDHLITREISIGDYVLTGGELAAVVLTDAICRLLPGALSDSTSALSDSFQDNLLAPPVYTRPADYHGWKVPEILLSGHERLVSEWKMEQAVAKTKKLRPDILKDEGSEAHSPKT